MGDTGGHAPRIRRRPRLPLSAPVPEPPGGVPGGDGTLSIAFRTPELGLDVAGHLGDSRGQGDGPGAGGRQGRLSAQQGPDRLPPGPMEFSTPDVDKRFLIFFPTGPCAAAHKSEATAAWPRGPMAGHWIPLA